MNDYPDLKTHLILGVLALVWSVGFTIAGEVIAERKKSSQKLGRATPYRIIAIVGAILICAVALIRLLVRS